MTTETPSQETNGTLVCVRHHKGWCATNRKSTSYSDTVPTLCGYKVTLPFGIERRSPDCPECKRIISGNVINDNVEPSDGVQPKGTTSKNHPEGFEHLRKSEVRKVVTLQRRMSFLKSRVETPNEHPMSSEKLSCYKVELAALTWAIDYIAGLDNSCNK